MKPTNPDGTLWAADTAYLAGQQMRAQVIAELRQRDETLSNGRMNAGNNWAPCTFVPRSEDEPERGGVYQPDPVCVQVHHTGDDTRQLTNYRWGEFCKVPQDEQPFRERLDREARERQIAKLQAGGETLAKELAEKSTRPLGQLPLTETNETAMKEQRPELSSMPSMRRSPGRPSKNRPERIG